MKWQLCKDCNYYQPRLTEAKVGILQSEQCLCADIPPNNCVTGERSFYKNANLSCPYWEERIEKEEISNVRPTK